MSSSEPIGTLTFEANYALIYGLFTGYNENALCTPLASADFSFFNDVGPKVLTIAVTSAGGLAGPVDLADCQYEQYHAPLEPGDFRILNTAATAPGDGAVAATVEVSSVDCGVAP